MAHIKIPKSSALIPALQPQAKLYFTSSWAPSTQEADDHDAVTTQPVQPSSHPIWGQAWVQRLCSQYAQEQLEVGIQPRLMIGRVGDRYEVEADAIADKVVSMPEPKPQAQVQRQAEQANQAGADLESRLSHSKYGGIPLPDHVHSFMSPRLGADLSSVRVHTDSESARMNQELGAQAFAHGNHVYYGAGKGPANDHLTAHELTHTIQQGAVVRSKTTPTREDLQQVVPVGPRAEVKGATIQRQPLPMSAGRVMGHIPVRVSPGQTVNTDIRFESEIVPSEQRPGRYDGYPNRTMAATTAGQQTHLTGLAEDREGKYHVLKTDYPKARSTSYTIIPTENTNITHLWWIGASSSQPGRSGAGSWAERVGRARDWHSHWRRQRIPDNFPQESPIPGASRNRESLETCLKAIFRALLSEALRIDEDLIYVARSQRDHSPTHLVTFDLYEEERGRGGIGRMPTDRDTEAPQPILNIGPAAFVSESHLHTLATAIHESEHFQHATDSIRLLQQWRRSGSRVTFEEWLRTQRRRGRITQEQYDLAMEEVRGGSSVTESLVRLRAFKATYHRLPITETIYRFTQIDGLAEYWPRAGHTVQDRVISELGQYYRSSLDHAHQEDFASHARRCQRTVLPEMRLFWNRVVERVL